MSTRCPSTWRKFFRKLFIQARGGVAQISGNPQGEKRFGTIQLCIHGGSGAQPPLCLIFRGKGGVLAAERPAYHPSVKVLFQDCAWADPTVCRAWVDQVLKPWHSEKYPDGKDFLMLMDNLAAQRGAQFVKDIHALGGSCAYGPPGKTEGWQPIDAGHIGAQLKCLAKVHFELWMEQKGADEQYNWQKWEKNAMTTREKRVLMTWIFGNAYDELCGHKCQPTHRKMISQFFQPLQNLR